MVFSKTRNRAADGQLSFLGVLGRFPGWVGASCRWQKVGL